MALNRTFDGYAYLNDGSLSNSNVYYQGFFYPNGTASSSSTWNNVRQVEATGYYNINLGDGDWLTQEGTALTNARVIIVFWRGDTTDRNSLCDVLDEWGAFEVTITSADVYTNQVQIKTNISPILNWSLPLTGYVNTSYTATNNSYDVHAWTWMGTAMNHWRTRYGQNIQLINNITNSDYYWGDTTSNLNVAGIASRSHQWSSAGTYEVSLVIEDECVATVTGTKYISIAWHAPTPDIIMTPSNPLPNEPVYFRWNGTDNDNAIGYIDWTINDSGTYGNTNTTTSGSRDATIPHSSGLGTDWVGQTSTSGAFTNPGSHLVSIIYHWFDGFVWHHDTYSESFTQNKFTGPTVNFEQIPSQATVASGVVFSNTSTTTSRVGLGLPNGYEYDWAYTESGFDTDALDKPYSYDFEVVPLATDAQVQLCAWWSDGWDTKVTCVEKSVVFATTVFVDLNDCYYDLYVTGTSSDGSVTGYSWTIASGISDLGPWTDIWHSPVGIAQQEKSVCFTSVGWYNITGYVYGTGTTTYDSQTLYVEEVCPTTSGITCSGITDIIWNGTGVLDLGGDWEHSGYGTEQTYAMHAGTNGLDAVGIGKNDSITFTKAGGTDTTNHDVLVMWIKLLSWMGNRSEVKVEFQTLGGGGWNNALNLSTYADVTLFNVWQRVVIPLYQFNLGNNTVHKLKLTSNDNIGFYLDDVAFGVGVVLAIGDYTMTVDEVGEKNQHGQAEDVSLDANLVDPAPSPKPKVEDFRPSMKGSSVTPSLKPVPGPTNL